jgi:hypothetical protein
MFLRIADTQSNIMPSAQMLAVVCTPVQAAESESLNGLNRLRQISQVDASEFLIETI